jgi:hypothetical protein
MAVLFVIGLTNSGPNAPHEFIMMPRAIVEATIGFPEGIRLLSRCDEVTFGREPRNYGPFLSASG